MDSIKNSSLLNILDGLVEGVAVINSKGIVQAFNKSAEDIFGYLSNEVIGENISIIMTDADRGSHDQYIEKYNHTGVGNIVGIGRIVIGVKKNGDDVPIRLSIRDYPEKVNGETWYIGSFLDVTLQQKQEEQLLNSIKMDAIGKLTGGIAHDYNNMLSVILGFSELLKENLTDSPALLDYTKQISYAATRGAELTKKLLSVSKEKTGDERVVLLNDILQDDYKILQKTVSEHIKIEFKLAKDLWPVYCDLGCLEDSILNISINAKHAMPEGGTLCFTTKNVRIGSVESQILQVMPGDYVKIAISDSGMGMNKDTLSHIFEPFFTTKDEYGTGLGLSQVYRFVKQSNGGVKVYSEVGHGTCFTIYIPRHLETSSAQAELNLQASHCKVGYETILVVDDEPALRELLATILISAGYNILTARGGIQALDLLATNKIDIVISDVIMPEMDGYELAHIIQHTYPDIKIQLTSGFSEDRGKTVTNEKLYRNLLNKPYTTDEILEKVEDLIHHT